MRYAGIDKCDLCNGNDIGTSLYVQGCNAHCFNCFNPETWSFDGGMEWTEEIETQFIESINKGYIKRISFLGGEPLAEQNLQKISDLITTIKSKYPNKDIWVYTGYEYEDLINKIHSLESPIPVIKDGSATYLFSILKKIDYLVDGRYVDRLRNPALPFRGSENQRIINVQRSLFTNQIVLYECEGD